MKEAKERERGSAVIEAVLCLTIFMVAILTILSFINLCRAQAMISNAVDATAREMSQYAYFYHLSGLEEWEKELAAETQDTRDKVNKIAGGTEAVYKVLESFEPGSGQDIDIGGLINTVFNGDSGEESALDKETQGTVTSQNVGQKIDAMTSALTSIKDPLAFMKGIVQIGAMEGLSMAKSQLIAAPLAKVLIKKHFEVDGRDADAYLRSFHIDGMDALNFKLSTVFSPAEPDDIHLVVYYQVDMVKFFNFDFGKVNLCKEAVTRAWLGGDRIVKKAADETESVWTMASVKYGEYIAASELKKLKERGCYEAGVSGVDAFDPATNTWIKVRSMDTFSNSYLENMKAIKAVLSSEYSDLATPADKKKDVIAVIDGDGNKTEVSSEYSSRKMQLVLVVPEGGKTEAFNQAIAEFLELNPDIEITVQEGYGKSPNDPDNQAGGSGTDNAGGGD